MAAVQITGSDVLVTLERNEKVWGFLSDLSVPLSSVSSVETVPDGRQAVTGVRAPGLGGTQRLIGTWRARGNRQYVCVRRGQPAVKLTLAGQRYQTVLVGLDDADSILASIRRALGS